MKLKMLDLFSGIGGFSLAASWTDCIETVAFCEIEPFRHAVLRKYWPNIPIFSDIRELRGEDVGTVDIVCGGFPCQPFSCAGKRRGTEDDRYLWPEMFRVIREVRPTWVVGENVANIINLALDTVLSDLESEGYETATFIIPACAIGAPHRRDRVWIVAHSSGMERKSGAEEQGVLRRMFENGKECYNADGSSETRSGDVAHDNTVRCNMRQPEGQGVQRQDEARYETDSGSQTVAHTNNKRLQRHRELRECPDQQFIGADGEREGATRESEPCLGGEPYGLSFWVDLYKWPAPLGREQYEWESPRLASKMPHRVQRLRALGDAIVPQVVYPIFQAIVDIEKMSGGILCQNCVSL